MWSRNQCCGADSNMLIRFTIANGHISLDKASLLLLVQLEMTTASMVLSAQGL